VRVLVAGGGGFIGSHLVDLLLGRGDEVVAIDSFVTGRRSNLSSAIGRTGFHLVEHDVTDPIPDLGDFDAVLNLASPASPDNFARFPLEILLVGSTGTRRLLDLAGDRGSRFLQASTSEVYGDPEEHPQTEGYWGNVNPIGLRSCYDEGKRLAETLMMDYHRSNGVDTRIVRIFNTYGPRMRHSDGRVIPAFISQALRGQPLTIFGEGTQTRSFCFVSDLIDGFLRLMESELKTPCNIGNPHERTMLQLAEQINQITGNTAGIVHRPLPKDDPTRRRPDISLATAALGWAPQVSFEEGIGRTIGWFKETIEQA